MVILITGTSKGIGFELVKKCSENNTNLVIAVSRNIQPLERLVKAGQLHNVLPLKCDITNEKQRKKIAETLRKLNLKLDALVNNAGMILNKPFHKINATELFDVYDTNVFAPFALIQILMPYLQTKTKPHIVNIGSMGGFQGSSKFSGLTAYSSSKAALACLTECLAEELKGKNVSVNCLALGAVQTEMLSKAFPGYKATVQPQEMANYIYDFIKNGKVFNGKILPVSSSTP